MITKENLSKILQDMAITAGMVNLYKDEKRYEKNFRECPFFSELVGEQQVLNILEIPFEWEFNEDCSRYTAIKSGDIYIEV